MHIIIETRNLLHIKFNPFNTKPHLILLPKLILMYSVIIISPEYNSDTQAGKTQLTAIQVT